MGFDPTNKLPLTALWAALASPSAADYLAAGGYGGSLAAARQGGRNVSVCSGMPMSGAGTGPERRCS